jgi:hypothetical protein
MFMTVVFSACATVKCDCEGNQKYKKRKPKVSLLNYQKNSTFALQKDLSNSNFINL